jgi:hypothetical protein
MDSEGVPCNESEGNSGKLGSPDTRGQFGDFRLIEAKQNVENPEDTGASVASEEYEVDDPLDPHGFVKSIVPQEAVRHDDDFGRQGDTVTMVRPCEHHFPFIILVPNNVLSSSISHHWA